MSYPQNRMPTLHDAFWNHLWCDVKRALGKDLKRGVPVWRGQADNKYGYHIPAEHLPHNHYSVMRPVDRAGPRHLACAIDWIFPSARDGDHSHIAEVTWRILQAFDNPHDSRVGPHNVAEVFGTWDGKTVVGRVHGRYGSGDVAYLHMIHLAVNRQWADNAYVFRAIASVVVGESHDDWMKREHPRIRRSA